MSKKPDGGPAYPTAARGGMSLRDWFAGMALQGMLANGIGGSREFYSANAYSLADIMLAERDKNSS
jgi:hypothetical protein